jgi:hypothetical protein
MIERFVENNEKYILIKTKNYKDMPSANISKEISDYLERQTGEQKPIIIDARNNEIRISALLSIISTCGKYLKNKDNLKVMAEPGAYIREATKVQGFTIVYKALFTIEEELMKSL